MKKLNFIFGFLLIALSVYSQTPPLFEWQKSIGGTLDDIAQGIAQSPDGTYGVAGSVESSDGDVSGSFGNTDFLVAKLTPVGDTLWVKAFGGSQYDYATSIVANWDGGYTVAGYSDSHDGEVTGSFDPNFSNNDFWVVRLSSTGVIIWEKSYGGGSDDEANSIIHTQDNGYIITGFTSSNQSTNYHGEGDVWVLKIDSTGTEQWEKAYGGDGDENGNSIIQTTDGNFVIAGYSTTENNGDISQENSTNYNDFWVLKIDNSGNLLWENTFGGSDDDEASSIIQNPDGGYAVAGTTMSDDGDITSLHGIWHDFWVLKLDASGNLQWQKTYGGTEDEDAYAILQSSDGGYLVSGEATSTDDDVTNNTSFAGTLWFIKIADDGALQWNLSLGGTDETTAYSMIETLDGGYAMAGLAIDNGGLVTGNHDSRDFWILKLGYPLGVNEIDSETNLSTYPNPATNQLIVSSGKEPIQDISLFTLTGKNVLTQTILPEFENSQTVRLDVSSLPSGIYLLKATTAKGVFTRKWVKE